MMSHAKTQRRRGFVMKDDSRFALLCASVPLCEFSSFAAAVILCLVSPLALAQKADKPSEAAPAPSGPTAADELALDQSHIADKYAKLEQLMLKMAELEGLSNPKRAQLLTRAVAQSKERLTKTQLETIVKALNQKQLKKATDGQTTVQADLKALLELLMSENRSDRLKSEQQRIKEYIKEVDRLIRLEKSLQGQTEGGSAFKKLSEEQARIAGQTGDLARKIRENEEGGNEQKPADKKPDEQQPGDRENQRGQQGKQGQSQQGEKGQQGQQGQQNQSDQSKEQKPGDEKANPDKNQKPGDEKPGDQKPGDQKPSEGEKG